MDQEQIVIEVDGSQARREVDATNKSLDSMGETVVRVSDRSKNSIDRLITSMTKQAEIYGKTGVEKLIAQRDQLVARYGNEQRAVDAITKSYNSMIDVERKLIESKRQVEEASRRAAEQAKQAAEQARREAEQTSHFSARYAMLGAKDMFEGRSTFAAAEGVNLLRGLQGAPLLIGGTVAALAGLVLVAKSSATELGAFGLEMENLHARTGIATTNLNQFVFAAKVMGQDASVYERMMRGLSQALGENSAEGEKARATMQRLGVQVRDASTGELKSTESVLLNISAALKTLPEGFQRDAAAMDLMKRAGIETIPVLQHLAENINRADKLGLGISDAQLSSWGKYREQIDDAEAHLSVLKRNFQGWIAPAWIVALEALAASGKGIGSFFTLNSDHGTVNTAKGPASGFFGQPLAVADNSAAVAARTLADNYIRGIGAVQNPQERLRQAESALSKLTRPELGVTSLADAQAYRAAESKVEQLKAGIKAGEQITEEAKRSQEFNRAMGDRELSPMEVLQKRYTDFIAPHVGQAGPTAVQQNSARFYTGLAMMRLATKQKAELDTESDRAAGQSAEGMAAFSKSQMGSDDWKYLDASGKFDIEQGMKGFERNKQLVAEQDRTTLDIYSAGAQHASRMGSIGARKEGPQADIQAAQQEYAVKQQIRDVEMATIQAHAGSYDLEKEMGRIAIENAKDRYTLEEQIAEVRKKEFDEVQKTTEHLVNTLFTKPGSFSKELGNTVHAAILAPITKGISNVISTGLTPVIFGANGQGGIAGAFNSAFGGGGKKDLAATMDLHITATDRNTAALYNLAGFATNGPGAGTGVAGGQGAPGTPGGPSVGSAGGSAWGLGAFGAVAGASGIVSRMLGATQRQAGHDYLGAMTAGLGRPGAGAAGAPQQYISRDAWVPGAIGIGGSAMIAAAAGGWGPSQGGANYSSGSGAAPGSYSAYSKPSSPIIGDSLGVAKSAVNSLGQQKGGFAGALSAFKGGNFSSLGSFSRAQGTWDDDANNGAGAYTPGRITGVGGVAGGMLGAGGMALAKDGLMGVHEGSGRGIVEGTAGGAMIGMEYGGPMGAAIGASIGAGIGIGEMLAGVMSPEEKAIKYAKQYYGITISMTMAKQVAALAQSKYAGNVQLAVRDPQTRQMLQIYAQGTGQGGKFPMSAATPMGLSTSETSGKLYQDPTYQMGNAYSYQSSLPVYGGVQTSQLAGPTGPIQLNVNGQSAADLLAGRIADTVTPGYVQDNYAASLSASNGRVSNSAAIQQPGLITS